MKKLVAIILAAGEGTRMKSSLPKVLHPLCGKPLISWVYDSVKNLNPEKVYIVIGENHNSIRSLFSKNEKTVFVTQSKSLGSGDAVRECEKYLKNYTGDCLILCGDVPLLSTDTLQRLVSTHRKGHNTLTLLTTRVDNPYGYGRICRSLDNDILKIVEENEANRWEKSINEINSGIYCCIPRTLFPVARKLSSDNKKGEYYLTDCVELLRTRGEKIGSFFLENSEEVLGINNRKELAEMEKIVRNKILDNLMLVGVTIVDPEHTYIDADVSISQDTTILPGTIIKGATKIGSNCRIGPQTYIEDCAIGNSVEIRASFVYGTEVENETKIGPFAHIRPGSSLGQKVRIGNFTEVKKSRIGTGTKVSHLSYIGDSVLGKEINVGAGVITCNYDGVAKHRTVIGDKVFVGSNVNLIAPVRVGKKAVIGAGSTITKNVPAQSLAIARSREIIKRKYQLGKQLTVHKVAYAPKLQRRNEEKCK